MSKKVGNVGIIYSENVHYSSESKNLAHYLCGLLSASGYAQIFMIPYSSEGPISDISPNKRVLYKHPRNDKLLEIPVCYYRHWLLFNIPVLITQCIFAVVVLFDTGI